MREMRALLDIARKLDFPLLGAQPVLTLSSIPLPKLLELQGADDMRSFWSAFVSCVTAAEAAEASEEPQEALEALWRTVQLAAPPSGWEADEIANLPGAQAVPPPTAEPVRQARAEPSAHPQPPSRPGAACGAWVGPVTPAAGCRWTEVLAAEGRRGAERPVGSGRNWSGRRQTG